MKPPVIKNQLVSAGRINTQIPPQYLQAQLSLLRQQITTILKPLMPWLECEPWLFSDDHKGATAEQLAAFFVARQTEFFYSTTPEGEVIGLQAIVGYRPYKWSYYLAWCSPKFRRTKYAYQAAKEVIAYTFAEPPRGLGLLKLRAEVTPVNYPALRACRALGFRPVGLAELDTFHNGEPCPILYLDLFNPAILPFVQELTGESIKPEPELFVELQRAESLQPGPAGAGVFEPLVERGSVPAASSDGPGDDEPGVSNGANAPSRAPSHKRKSRSKSKRRSA